MSTYVIGDLQGCYDEFRLLLERLAFDPTRDRLLLAGDLVNRGPDSLRVLRYVRSLGEAAESVLGNHDLHLLACAHGHRSKRGDTIDEVLQADDRDELLEWLARRPLSIWHQPSHTLIVHAGLAPQWSIADARACAAEVERALADGDRHEFFKHMYGDQPDSWSPELSGWDRLRFITNCFTRLRYCSREGRLSMRDKGAPGTQRPGLLPWFQVPGRRSTGTRIAFGHWSTLGTVRFAESQVFGLDTGCLWGGALTALRLEDDALFSLPCPGQLKPG